MKPCIIILTAVSLAFFFSGTSIDWGGKNHERRFELEDEIYEYEKEALSVRRAVDDCNDAIADVQSYAGSSYEEINEAIDSLEECEVPKYKH